MTRETITYGAGDGPVVLTIHAGYATLGKYRVSFREDGHWDEILCGALGDDVPDTCAMPLEGAELAQGYLLILGNYTAGDSSANTQVLVTYEFQQENGAIGKVQISQSTTGVVSAQTLVTFVAR